MLQQFEHLEDRVRKISQDQFKRYVHGYSNEESQRLNDQAKTMAEILHYDSFWEEKSSILEVGCGVGAQTKIITKQNPTSHFTSIDFSEKSLLKAQETINSIGIENVTFKKADVYELPFKNESFDHVFVCFVLEHLEKAESALKELKRVLKKNGTLTVIEGDHGSTFFYPDSNAARKAIQAQVHLQKKNGGNANIGRELFPLLSKIGFSNVKISPRQIYVDESKPEMVEGFIKNTFTAMIQGIKEDAITQKIISNAEMERGINDLYDTAQGGTFCYTFFKAVAVK
ncbi:methyltransferase domain-containing protein (plasmid) [Chondrinema litorale]|nr:methyltransferase domain-containing protein [Chondrinema litorale]UZR96752.1 methyltransferase domain-containing protein [Chondrinema litorale]